MELLAILKRVIGLDVHQAQITACAIIEESDGTTRVEQRQFGAFKRDRRELAEWCASFATFAQVIDAVIEMRPGSAYAVAVRLYRLGPHAAQLQALEQALIILRKRLWKFVCHLHSPRDKVQKTLSGTRKNYGFGSNRREVFLRDSGFVQQITPADGKQRRR